MDHRSGSQSPFFPASHQPGNYPLSRNGLPEIPPNNPLRQNGLPEIPPNNPRRRHGLPEVEAYDQYNLAPYLESFGNLSLNDDNNQLQSPGFSYPPVSTTDGFRLDPRVDYDYLMDSRVINGGNAELQGLIGAQNGFWGAHQNLYVGPDIRGENLRGSNLPGSISSEPWFEPNDYWRRRSNYEVAVNDGGFRNLQLYLQSKKSLSPREANYSFLYQNGFSSPASYAHMNGSVPSSNFGRYNYKNKQELRNWNQQSNLLLSNNLRARVVSQDSTRMLQAKLEKASEQEIRASFPEVLEYVANLMKNQSASFVVQKLFSQCSEEQRMSIITEVTRSVYNIFDICCDQSGAKAMVTLLQYLNTPEQMSMIMAKLTPVGVVLANDPSGQHVVQECVKILPIEYTEPLLNQIANNCSTIATDKSGCCTMQVCVDSSRGESRDRLITEIITNAVKLSEDPYGNYVLQHLVAQKLPNVTETLMRRLTGNFTHLSCNKFASHVIEKLLESGEDQSRAIIRELLKNPNASMLLVDPYGNYVIQKALLVSQGEVYHVLDNLIKMNSASIHSNMYGKKVLARFGKPPPPPPCTKMQQRQV